MLPSPIVFMRLVFHTEAVPFYITALSLKGVAQNIPSPACSLLTLRTDDSSSEAGFCPLASDMGTVMRTLVQGHLSPCAAYSTHHHLRYIPRVPVPGLLGTYVGVFVRLHHSASWAKGLISSPLPQTQALEATTLVPFSSFPLTCRPWLA